MWVHLHREKGIKNYIHLLGSGHILVYMTNWGNLNHYSQQGWEALNALIKIFFFWWTNKGGHKSGTDSMSCNNNKSKLVPIMRFVQRRMLFLCKILDTDCQEQVQQILNNKKEVRKQKIVTILSTKI